MTGGDFAAKGLWFSIGVLAYSLIQIQKPLFLNAEWRPRTIGTLRWRLVGVAGRLIWHGRRWVLRLAASAEKFAILLEHRRWLSKLLLT